jgi:hypothetical protein
VGGDLQQGQALNNAQVSRLQGTEADLNQPLTTHRSAPAGPLVVEMEGRQRSWRCARVGAETNGA